MLPTDFLTQKTQLTALGIPTSNFEIPDSSSSNALETLEIRNSFKLKNGSFPKIAEYGNTSKFKNDGIGLVSGSATNRLDFGIRRDLKRRSSMGYRQIERNP